MDNCKHEALKVEDIFENAGQANQRRFSFIRCKNCGNIFPINPTSNISDKLQGIIKALVDIGNKIK
jgi:hypothetical protein